MKVYNNFDDTTSKLAKFFLKISNNIAKPQARNLAYLVISAIDSNSIINSELASSFKNNLSLNKPESNEKRIFRFLHNSNFNENLFFNDLIKYIFTNYKKKHKDGTIFIAIDHTFNRDDFVTLVITYVIGKQSIPIYFKCYDCSIDNNAFDTDTIVDAIKNVRNYFNDNNITFLADRWFDNPAFLKTFDEMNVHYAFRTKTNKNVSLDNGESFISLSDIKSWKIHPRYFNDIIFSESTRYKTNLVISPNQDTDDPWYILTNDNPNKAIKYYGKRFGGIECNFKNQKTNGFFLEKTTTRNIDVFSKKFAITSIAIIFLTILGCDYSRNKTHSKYNFYDTYKSSKTGKFIRKISFFALGKKIFKYAYNSFNNYKLKFNFILYDV